MPIDTLIALSQEGLLLAVVVALPVIGAAFVVTFIVSLFQAATEISDSTLSHVPRLVAVTAALVALGPWIGSRIAEFAVRAFTLGS
jgi:flagellar biosynthetic protein FliQ